MKTTAAFQALLKNIPQRTAAGISAKRAANLMHRLRTGSITSEKMTEILLSAGFKIKKETEWLTPQEWENIINTTPE